MDLSKAVELYASGLSLREVGARLGVKHPFSVSYQLERAGIALGPNGNAHRWQRVELHCDSCGRPFLRRQYDVRNGNGVNAAPNAPRERFCSPECHRWGLRRLAQERARNTVTIEVNYR